MGTEARQETLANSSGRHTQTLLSAMIDSMFLEALQKLPRNAKCAALWLSGSPGSGTDLSDWKKQRKVTTLAKFACDNNSAFHSHW